ncbi:two-component sensor histidine kinase [Ottowia sp. GY511]|uniref:histidine kinase n=1 Tax=Ottowia flava TaxID=2675430 RepID=A0ABW4KPB6_9BURK|nr:ATP-binding protein [Ottowia sp. GY511]TXK24720.1 two-component sensor histidine kinase [Ottowia sp. GY511]
MPRRPLTLTQRLVAMVLGFVLAVWLVTAGVAWFVTQHELYELLDAHLAQTAALLATGELEDDKTDVQVQAPVLLHKYQSRVAFQIWHKGRLRARSADAPDTPLAPGAQPGLSDQVLDGLRWRVFTAERSEGGRVKDVIYVGEHQSARRHVLLGSLRGTLVPLLLALPLLAAGVIWSVRQALRPLRELSTSVATRRPQALAALPEAQAPPEVRPLVRALNGLFGRMTEVLASERRFTSDAAHELRTPIAAIRMQAQVARGATDDAERRVALDATVAGCDRATRVVEQLLQLARLESDSADPGARAAPVAEADLGAVAAEQVAECEPQTRARVQHVTLERPNARVPVTINATLLTVLLRNLLDNASRYSPEGAQVAVQVAAATAMSGAVLTVEDSGPGLSDADLQRLGDRFFRVLGTGQAGSGLGWSIVRRLARLYELDVQVDRSPALGGLRVQVRWPALRG